MSKRKAVFFDLDGTLTRMNLNDMFKDFYKEMEIHGVLQIFHKDFDTAVKIYNDAYFYSLEHVGTKSNADVFFEELQRKYGIKRSVIEPAMDNFFENDFHNTGRLCEPHTLQREIIDTLKQKGYRLILATFPCFPESASQIRLKWAGLDLSDFEYNTHYYNCKYYKPAKEYYDDILKNTNLQPGECIMVGNDVKQDMCTADWGFEVFLLTGYQIGENTQNYREGNLAQLLKYARELPRV